MSDNAVSVKVRSYYDTSSTSEFLSTFSLGLSSHVFIYLLLSTAPLAYFSDLLPPF